MSQQPELSPLIVRFEGREWILERVQLEDLVDWKEQRGLQYAGIGWLDGETFPTLIYEEVHDGQGG